MELKKVKSKYKWNRYDYLLLACDVFPILLGVIFLIFKQMTPAFWFIGIGLGFGIGAGMMRQLMIKHFKEVGIEITGKKGQEEIVFYKPVEGNNETR